MGKTMATRGAIEIGAALLGLGQGGRLLADIGGQLLTLKYGRDDETEADKIGLVLAARAGYDPGAGVTLWKKMGEASKGGPPEFLSTHPSGPSRIRDIEDALPRVEPLYARAPKPDRQFEPAQPKGNGN
jgi:predicted Zn-dependent protease